MAIDPALPRTRRAVLAAGLGGLAATALSAVVRPEHAAAANGDPVTAGAITTATATTELDVTTASANGFTVVMQGGSTGNGIYGSNSGGIGVRGVSSANTGLRGDSTSGTAVRALSVSGRAINATSGGTATAVVSAQLTSGAIGVKSAVQGYVGSAALPTAATETGVQGRCDISTNSVGVLGQSASGTAVFGDSTNGIGVLGSGSITGVEGDSVDAPGVAGYGYWGVYGNGTVGVLGDVDSGTGVQGWSGTAAAPDPLPTVGVWAAAEMGRTALQVSGVAKFTRSGRVAFASGQSSKVVTVSGGITTAAFAFANLQTNRAGVYVQAVVPSTAGTITIYLNKAVTASTACGWMVIS